MFLNVTRNQTGFNLGPRDKSPALIVNEQKKKIKNLDYIFIHF